ncbi:Na+/H+ antiporter NhaC family protein [Fodinibius sediminis]|uniref:Transporter, NhaC family n=1 Tax=Fodinibius sediminis TaxID=1214077 RepID=A0A521CMD6_9BACT|nr:Na+/H+ antiporter NhaC family protein [Fodinibius sediminis]SMO60603.1 transporter, NhaC family [Fodinibius sediminis]
MNDWIVILPPIVAIGIALWRREVILSLLAALFLSEWMVASYHPGSAFTGLLERLVTVFENPSNTSVLLFSLMVGALIEFIKTSGGVSALVQRLSAIGLTKTPRQVGMLTTITGIFIFIETNLSILTAGILSRGLFDKFDMSRERLAYVVDSTCAPVAVLILLNGWGAYLLGLIGNYEIENPVSVLAATIPLNFYALLTLGLVFYTVLTGRVYGPMKKLETHDGETDMDDTEPPTNARYMLVPLAVMTGGILFFLWLTGDGNIMEGEGATSVLWATALAIAVGYLLLRFEGVYTHRELVDLSFEGMSNLLPLVTIVLLSIALGMSLQDLGTGSYISSLIGVFLPRYLIIPLIFLASGAIAFTTGTSWGTFALMIPIGIPLALDLGLAVPLLLSAVIGGGVFGDHCSPISDTTLMSSLAAGCDHLDHVKTQLPYALVTGGITFILYLVIGLI